MIVNILSAPLHLGAIPVSLAADLLPDSLPPPGELHHLPGVHQAEPEGVADVVARSVSPPVLCLYGIYPGCALISPELHSDEIFSSALMP